MAASQAKLLHSLGANLPLQHHPDADTNADVSDLLAKLVFNYSSRVCFNMVATNLAPSAASHTTAALDGHTLATPYTTSDAKDVLNCLGGIQVLFPILETSLYNIGLSQDSSSSYISLSRDNSTKSVEEADWELLPSSSFSDWNLERNPVSGFITLVKNMTTGHAVNAEQLMRGGGVAIMGALLQRVDAALIDVNVLMASQLFVEILSVTRQTKLLYQFYHSILLDFRIWSRSEFHMQIGHIQYISTLVMADRKYFRKKFGVQFFLDVVRQHYAREEGSVNGGCGEGVLSLEDTVTIRGALFGLVKFFLQKDVNAREANGLLNFMFSFRRSALLGEVLDMLVLHVESKLVKDQLFLLMTEPKCLDLSYCLLLENREESVRAKIYKVISAFLKTSRVSNRHKGRLHLQQAGYLGWLYMRASREPVFSLAEVTELTDHMLLFDHASSYQGILALCAHLQMAEVRIKLEAARKLLTLVYAQAAASAHLSKQTGWQGAISRLLVKEIVEPELDAVASVEDVISLGEDEEYDLGGGEDATGGGPASPTHYINLVTDTAKAYLPAQAGNAVKKVGDSVGSVADEAGKVLAGTSKIVRSTVQRTQNLVNDKVHSASQKVNTTVKTANSLLETVGAGDLSSLSRRKRQSNASLDGNDPQFLHSNYAFADGGGGGSLGGGDTVSVSSDDMSRSRETICSSPTRTHESISEDDISFDMDHFGAELESLRNTAAAGAVTGANNSSVADREEELVGLVVNILFSVLWRGTLTRHRKDQAAYLLAAYGQIVAAVNLLALNNKLFVSHVVVKRRLADLCVAALLSDLRERNQTLSEHSLMAKNIMEMVFDLVVLDEHEDFSKKVGESLLDGVLGILDGFAVFHEDAVDNEWEDMGKMAFSILLECADNARDLDFCAIATAKLHSLVQTRKDAKSEEIGFLIMRVNKAIQNALAKGNTEHYAFLVPIMKALLDKSKACLQLNLQLPSLNLRYALFRPSMPLHLFFCALKIDF